ADDLTRNFPSQNSPRTKLVFEDANFHSSRLVGDDLDTPITSVPGMEGLLRRRDLPAFCRSGDLSNPSIQLFKTEIQELPRAHGLILNTMEDLEGPVLSHIRAQCPNLYTIGPVHAQLKSKLSGTTTPSSTSSSNSLRKEDTSCITWLDSQPSKSVIYISFGSLAVITKDQLIEFWHGVSYVRSREGKFGYKGDEKANLTYTSFRSSA
ncbi:hypothetical protein RJ639_026433, partial [Escallonia herrerae]